jgi:hypothetical protein
VCHRSLRIGEYPQAPLLGTWFHPFLLRLNYGPGLMWISSYTLVLPIAYSFDLDSFKWPGLLRDFVLLSLPGLALVNYRTRAWMILPVAAFYLMAIRLLGGVSGVYCDVLAKGLYGATPALRHAAAAASLRLDGSARVAPHPAAVAGVVSTSSTLRAHLRLVTYHHSARMVGVSISGRIDQRHQCGTRMYRPRSTAEDGRASRG